MQELPEGGGRCGAGLPALNRGKEGSVKLLWRVVLV